MIPPIGELTFDEPPGDVHIKYGYIKGEPNYVIKSLQDIGKTMN